MTCPEVWRAIAPRLRPVDARSGSPERAFAISDPCGQPEDARVGNLCAFEDAKRTIERIWQDQRVGPDAAVPVAAPARADQMELFRAGARET